MLKHTYTKEQVEYIKELYNETDKLDYITNMFNKRFGTNRTNSQIQHKIFRDGLSKKEYVIVGVTPDEYELPILVFDSYDEMSKVLNISKSVAHSTVCRGSKRRKLKLKFIRIEIEGVEE